MKIIFDIQKFGGGGGSTTQTYTPSEYELEMQNTASQYSKDVAPNARWLNTRARQLLEDSLGVAQVDFTQLNDTAQNRIKKLLYAGWDATKDNTDSAKAVNELLQKYSSQLDETTSGLNDKVGNLVGDVNQANTTANNSYNSLTKQLGNATTGANDKLGDYIGDNDKATDTVNGLLGGYMDKSSSSTTGTNADLSEYIRRNKDAFSTAEGSLSGLQNGTIPTEYQTAMENAIASALTRTIGSNVNNLAQRGVINSSVTNSALNDIEKNAADSVAQNYLNNINTLQNLAQNRWQNAITTDNENAAMTNQMYSNTQTDIDRLTNLAQQQYQNAMGNNQTNAGLTQQALGNTQNYVQNAGQFAQNNFNNANTTATNAANLYGQQYQQYLNSANTMADWANQQNTNTLNANSTNAGIYNNLLGNVNLPITTAAAAQEAAQQPAINLWNASIGLNGTTTGALSAAAGKGTTTTTQSGGGGLLSGLFGGLF